MKRFFDILNVGLMVALVWFAVWVWPDLPERIPTHFGIDGQPDAWGDRSFWSWFLLPIITVTLALSMYWVRWVLPRRPGWVSLPSRRRLTDFPEAARGPILEMVSGFLALVQTHLLVIFILIQLATYRTALGADSQGVMILVLLLAMLGSPLFLVVFFLRYQRAMAETERLAAGEV